MPCNLNKGAFSLMGMRNFFWGADMAVFVVQRLSLKSFPRWIGAVKNVDRERAMGKYVGK